MAEKATHKVPFRRRREKKTDYRKRLASVKSGKPKMVVRKSNKSVLGQVIQYSPKGDKTLVHCSSRELKKLGWNLSLKNIPAAYLTGLMLGVKAKKKNIYDAVPDIGMATPVHGSAVFAAVKGAADAGMKVALDKKAAPKEERIKGKHIESYKKEKKASEAFENTKKKILKDSPEIGKEKKDEAMNASASAAESGKEGE